LFTSLEIATIAFASVGLAALVVAVEPVQPNGELDPPVLQANGLAALSPGRSEESP
jgi:hypothetical protein